jgi:hypothetical protein
MVPQPEHEHHPTNGAHPSPTLPEGWQDPGQLMWSLLLDEQRLEMILDTRATEEWYQREPYDYLSTLAYFHPIPAQWGRIWERFKSLGGKPTMLEAAVRQLLSDEQTPRATEGTAGTVPARFTTISAKALQAKHFAPLNWVIPGILPPGATLFTGRGKDGKSLLAWNLCMAVATGGKALGTYDVPQGDVLYLCLEDGERRAQARLSDQMAYMGQTEAPDNLMIVTRDPSTVGDGFEAKVIGWIEEHVNAKLIIVDILEKVRPKRTRSGSVYGEDYAALSPIQQIAQDHNIAILVIHHSNKTRPEDFRDTASGSTGLLAACDTFWSLSRLAGAADAVLNIIGRDVDSPALALQFHDGFWTVLGTAEEAQQSKASREVLDALTTAGKPLTPKELASTLALPVGTIYVRLKRMLERGEVHTYGDSRYIPALSPPPPKHERETDTESGAEGVRGVRDVRLEQSERALQGGVRLADVPTTEKTEAYSHGSAGITGLTGLTPLTPLTPPFTREMPSRARCLHARERYPVTHRW